MAGQQALGETLSFFKIIFPSKHFEPQSSKCNFVMLYKMYASKFPHNGVAQCLQSFSVIKMENMKKSKDKLERIP